MQTKMSRFRQVCLALSLGAAATLALGTAHAETGLERVERTKTLRIGVINGAIPYFNKSLASGEWVGFGPDFGKSLASDLGVKLQYVETTWGNAVLDLQANKIDLMFGMAPTPVRKEMVNFTADLFNNTYTTVCRKGFPDKTWEQLNSPDVRIAVDVGSSHDNFATAKLPNASLSRMDSSGAATLALQTGKVDCQILVILLAQPLLAKRADIGEIHIPEPVLSAPVSIGLPKETDLGLTNAVNTWMTKQKEAGAIKQVILDNMQKLAGVKPEDFPANVKF